MGAMGIAYFFCVVYICIIVTQIIPLFHLVFFYRACVTAVCGDWLVDKESYITVVGICDMCIIVDYS